MTDWSSLGWFVVLILCVFAYACAEPIIDRIDFVIGYEETTE